MALLHQAELRPSKLELMSRWAPSQPWFRGDVDAEFTGVASYRFDDPAGEVGVETLLVRAGEGPTMHVPLTYRDAALAGADEWLIGTLEHSVLGTRWVYDGVGDPVYLLTVSTAVITGGRQADLYVDVNGESVPRDPSAVVFGSEMNGVSPPALPTVDELTVRTEDGVTVVETERLRITVARVLDDSPQQGGTGILTGSWAGQPEPRPLVFVAEL